MKKKILLFFALLTIFTCFFAISVSAETPSDYIVFKVKFVDADEYITAYTKDVFPTDSKFDFNEPFYTDVEFTQEINKDNIAGVDLSDAAPSNKNTFVKYIASASTPYANCKEIKWFNTAGSANAISTIFFQNWIALESFDFGIATQIVDKAFANTGFKTLVIPSTITTIKGGAFSDCVSLTSLKIVGNITSLSGSAFNGCTSLSSVDLGNSLTTIGEAMFSGCTSLTSIDIPPSVSTIKSQAFYNCSSLSNVTFGDINSIGSSAFYQTAIVSVTIPKEVTSVGGSSFANCKSLTTVVFEEGFCGTLGSSAFKGCTSLSSVDLGNSLTTIGEAMFSGCTSLTSIDIPPSVSTIKSQAFYNCSSLSNVTFGDINSIGSSAFYQTAIVSVTIPKEVTSVGGSSFANCKSLTTVVFEEGFCGTLGSSAFMGTSALTTLTLVEGITDIPSQCFWSCGTVNGIEKVTLPDSVVSLAGRAFNGSGIKVLEIRETSNLRSITGDAFAGMKSLKSIYLPTGVVISCDNLFQYCHALEEVLNFENVIINIANYGENVFVGKIFYECMALKELRIPKSTTAIDGTAFRLYDLERVYIPSSITSIASGWLDNTTHIPSKVIFFYCGGDADKLLSLTNDGAGVVSTRIAGMIENNSVVAYSGLNETYTSGVIVYNVNSCDIYYGGYHVETDKIEYMFIDENGNPTTEEYTSRLKVFCPCGRNCGNETIIKIVPALFKCLGYSVFEGAQNGITVGFMVDNDAILEYTTFTGKEIEFGVFAASKDKLGNGDIFDASGLVTSGVIAVPIHGREFGLFEIKIVGFKNEQKNSLVTMGAYVATTKDGNTEHYYIQPDLPLQSEKYSFVTYDDLLTQLK